MTLAEIKEFIKRFGESPRTEEWDVALWRIFDEMGLIEKEGGKCGSCCEK